MLNIKIHSNGMYIMQAQEATVKDNNLTASNHLPHLL